MPSYSQPAVTVGQIPPLAECVVFVWDRGAIANRMNEAEVVPAERRAESLVCGAGCTQRCAGFAAPE